MYALSYGFQEIGFTAAGLGGTDAVTAMVNTEGAGSTTAPTGGSGVTLGDATVNPKDIKPDNIIGNAITIAQAVFEWVCNLDGLIHMFLGGIVLIVVVICLFLTAIEMFMCRIEFYTMALLTMPLLAFGTIKKFSFLADKAVGAMFNLAIKLSVISFLTGALIPILNTYRVQIENASKAKTGALEASSFNITLLVQLVLACLVIYLLTKKIPELVSGLLSGNPSLAGSSMTQMATSAGRAAANTAASAASGVGFAVGAVQGAHAAAKAGGASGFKQLAGGTLQNLGAAAGNALLHQNSLARGHQGGVRAMIGSGDGQSGLLSAMGVDNGTAAALSEIKNSSQNGGSPASKLASTGFSRNNGGQSDGTARFGAYHAPSPSASTGNNQNNPSSQNMPGNNASGKGKVPSGGWMGLTAGAKNSMANMNNANINPSNAGGTIPKGGIKPSKTSTSATTQTTAKTKDTKETTRTE